MASVKTLGAEGEPRPPKMVAESIVALMKRDLPLLPCYVGPAVLPKGGKLLLGGEAKIGKSFLCMEFARALATGGRLFHADTLDIPGPARVLYVEQEIGVQGIRKRAITMLAGEDEAALDENFLYVSKTPDLFVDQPQGLAMLDELVGTTQPNVLVLDPASRLIEGDDSDNKIVRAFWRNLDKLIKRHEALELSVVVAHHFKKPPVEGDYAMDDEERYSPHRFRGGGDWYNAPDTIETIIRPTRIPDERSWLLGVMHTTRHGFGGEVMYLRIAPEEGRSVTQLPKETADVILAEIEERRQSKKKRGKAKGDGPQSGREEKIQWGMGGNQ